MQQTVDTNEFHNFILYGVQNRHSYLLVNAGWFVACMVCDVLQGGCWDPADMQLLAAAVAWMDVLSVSEEKMYNPTCLWFSVHVINDLMKFKSKYIK